MDDDFNDTGGYQISLRGAVSSCATTDTSAPTVTAIAPQPGELVTAGSRYRIRWSSADDVGVTSHTIRLSTDGGATFSAVLASDISGTAQSFLWTVPISSRSTTARVRVLAQDATGATGQAETAGNFSIIDDPMPREISYSYDSLNRLVGVEYSDGSTITYAYDEVGNRETLTSTGPVVIHADGFESGDTSAWSGASGSLTVTPQAAEAGSYGLRLDVGCPGGGETVVPVGTLASGIYEGCRSVTAGAVRIDPGPVVFRAGQGVRLADGFSVASGASFVAEIDPTVVPDAFVRDDSPDGLTRYGVRFSSRLDGLTLGAGERVELFSGADSDGVAWFRAFLERGGAGEDLLVIEAREDDGAQLSTEGGPLPVPAGWHSIELSWRAAAAGKSNGRLDLFLDGAPRARLTGLDNGSGRIDFVTLGSVGAGPGSIGFLDIDGFLSQPQL
jgi:YD repeat-containing protein